MPSYRTVTLVPDDFDLETLLLLEAPKTTTVPVGPPGPPGPSGGTETVGGIAATLGDVPLFDEPTGTIRVATPEQYAVVGGVDTTAGGTDWTAAANAVLAAGKCLVGKFGKTYPCSGRITVPEGAYVGGFGGAAKGTNLGSTTFQLTSSGAGFDFVDGGHTIQDVMVDGGTVATQHVHIGSSDPTHVGAQPTIRGLAIKGGGAGGSALWIQGTQNGRVHGLNLINPAGEAIRYTDRAGGWKFYGFEITGAGSYAFHSIDGGSVKFDGGVMERDASTTQAAVFIESTVFYPTIVFDDVTFASGGSSVAPSAALTGATLAASTDTITKTAHGLFTGCPVQFTSITGSAGITAGTTYYLINKTANTFQVSATLGGSAIDITTDGTADVSTVYRYLVDHRASGTVQFEKCNFAGITNEIGIGVHGVATSTAPRVMLDGATYHTGAGLLAFLDYDSSAVVDLDGQVLGQVAGLTVGTVPLRTDRSPDTNIGRFRLSAETIFRSASTLLARASLAIGDTFARFQQLVDGTLGWGPGNATQDVTLFRSAAKTLTLQSAGGTTPVGLTVVGDAKAVRHLPVPQTLTLTANDTTAGGAFAIDASLGDVVFTKLNGFNLTTIPVPSNLVVGQILYLMIKQGSGGGSTVTVPGVSAGWDWQPSGDSSKPVINSAANAWTPITVRITDNGRLVGTSLTGAVAGALLAANNLNDVADAATSRYNLHVPILSSVQCVSTANVASLSGTTTIDGVALAAGDPVLLTAQTTGSQNGPWLVQSGAWTRPLDYPAAGSVKGRCIHVNGGSTANAGSMWVLKTTTTVTIDTTATTWAQANSGAYLATAVLAALSTGVLKVTTGTGALSVAAAADIPTVGMGTTGPLSATDARANKPVNFQAPSGWFVLPCNLVTSTGVLWTTANKGIATWCAIDLEPGKTYNLLGVRVQTAGQVGGTTTTTVGLYGDLDGIPDLAGGLLASGTVTLTAIGNRTVAISYTPTKVRHWAACLYVESVAPSTYPTVHQFSVGLMVSSATIGSNARGYFASSLAALPTTAITLSDQTTPVVVGVGAA